LKDTIIVNRVPPYLRQVKSDKLEFCIYAFALGCNYSGCLQRFTMVMQGLRWSQCFRGLVVMMETVTSS